MDLFFLFFLSSLRPDPLCQDWWAAEQTDILCGFIISLSTLHSDHIRTVPTSFMLHIECRAVGQCVHSWVEYIKTHVNALVHFLNGFFYYIKGVVDPKCELYVFFLLFRSINNILKNVLIVCPYSESQNHITVNFMGYVCYD